MDAIPETMDISEVRGGSPYGAGTIAAPDGSRLPSANFGLTVQASTGSTRKELLRIVEIAWKTFGK